MIGVIIGARKIGINPDNVATPIAASLGDLITLSLLAGISSVLFRYIGMLMRKSWELSSKFNTLQKNDFGIVFCINGVPWEAEYGMQ